jgi:hypothetical protein
VAESALRKAHNAPPETKANPPAKFDDELAVKLVQAGGKVMDLLAGDSKDTIGLIQNLLAGILSSLSYPRIDIDGRRYCVHVSQQTEDHRMPIKFKRTLALFRDGFSVKGAWGLLV